MMEFSNFRQKRPRAAKPQFFVCEDELSGDNVDELPLPPGASKWVYLDDEKMYNFLASHPDTILSLHKGKITPSLLRKDQETGKNSIVCGSLGYPAGTAMMDRLTFTVSARIGADGACPFGLHETNPIFAGQPATYYAYIAVSYLPAQCIKAEFILMLEDLEFDKDVSERLRHFVVKTLHRNPKPDYESGEGDDRLWQEELDGDTINSRTVKKVRRKKSRSVEDQAPRAIVPIQPAAVIEPAKDSLTMLRDDVRQQLMVEMGPPIRQALLQAYEAKFQLEKQAKIKQLSDHLLGITSDEILTNPKYDIVKQQALRIAAEKMAAHFGDSAAGVVTDDPDEMDESPK